MVQPGENLSLTANILLVVTVILLFNVIKMAKVVSVVFEVHGKVQGMIFRNFHDYVYFAVISSYLAFFSLVLATLTAKNLFILNFPLLKRRTLVVGTSTDYQPDL